MSSTSTSSSSPPTLTNSGSSSGSIFSNGSNLTSLYLYTFIATIALLLVIFGALVARTIHLRRRRNAAYLAAIAAGTYVTPPHNGKRRYDPLLPKPALWEVHTTPHDPEKGWAEMLPVAGATLVPVTRQTITPLRRASWHLRCLSSYGRGHQFIAPPTAPDVPSRTPVTATTASLETPESSPPVPPPEPVSLAVLISMPTRTARTRAEQEFGGPPVVEFGVAHVSYADPAGT